MKRKYPVEALWGVVFATADNPSVDVDYGGGVIVLDTGRVMGGDGAFTYIGNYEIDGDKFLANIRVRRHNQIMDSVFGDIDDYELEAVGDFAEEGKRMMIDATVNGTGQKLVGSCRWLAELP